MRPTAVIEINGKNTFVMEIDYFFEHSMKKINMHIYGYQILKILISLFYILF